MNSRILADDVDTGHGRLSLWDSSSNAEHGSLNSYYLVDGTAEFHLTNDPQIGLLRYQFEGVVLTDQDDLRTRQVDVEAELVAEACDWLTRAARDWFAETVRRAVAVEFDRYIEAGDRDRALERVRHIREESDEAGGYLGAGL